MVWNPVIGGSICVAHCQQTEPTLCTHQISALFSKPSKYPDDWFCEWCNSHPCFIAQSYCHADHNFWGADNASSVLPRTVELTHYKEFIHSVPWLVQQICMQAPYFT